MKLLMAALLSSAVLLTSVTAHAFAVYNHTGNKVCVQTIWSKFYEKCKFRLGAHGTYNGEPGAGLNHAQATWVKGRACYSSDGFDIPKGGYIKIYDQEVKVYDGKARHLRSESVQEQKCPGHIHLE